MSRRKRVRGTALVAGALAAGCGRSTPPAPGAVEPAAIEPAAAAEPAAIDPAEAARALAPDAQTGDAFVRRTVYTWTTAEQVDELARTGRLLSRDESPTSGASYVDQVLFARAGQRDPIAKLLWRTGFARMRFAWHAPWATRDGWPGEQYGDRLIRITLAPAAIVLTLSTTTGAFAAHDLDGKPVAAADVIAHPARIAAIYFVSDAGVVAAAGLPPPRTSYREVVLCNEAMIESWAVGDDLSRRELAREADALDVLIRYLRGRPSPPASDAAARAFAAALAFDNANYRLDADALAALAARLRATPMPAPPITGGGGVAFAGPGRARPAPRVVGDGTGSFAAPPSTYATP